MFRTARKTMLEISTWFMLSFTNFLAVFVTARGNLGEAKYLTVRQFPNLRSMGPFSGNSVKK